MRTSLGAEVAEAAGAAVAEAAGAEATEETAINKEKRSNGDDDAIRRRAVKRRG